MTTYMTRPDRTYYTRAIVDSVSCDRKGGVVIVRLTDGTTASAKCHPDDEFNYDIGYMLALGRALKQQATKFAEEAQFLVRSAYTQVNNRSK